MARTPAQSPRLVAYSEEYRARQSARGREMKFEEARAALEQGPFFGAWLVLTLYSYPELFGVADNNAYGLKVFAFLRLTGVPFRHEHIFDASKAPRGQLPYIDDDSEIQVS